VSIQATAQDPFTILVSGGVITTVLTLFANWLIKRRQQRVDMSKIKIQTITKVVPLYNQIALYNSSNLSYELGKDNQDRDAVLMLYYICNIMNIRKQIIKKIGDIQLDNIDAERIIGNLYNNIITRIKGHFGHVDSDRMLHLVDNDIAYHRFHQKVSSGNDNDLYQKFVHWIYGEEITSEIERNCRWFAELIMYELNYVYRIWYNEPPDIFRLSQDLLNYLATNHPKYYHRIMKIETGGYLK
jgi:hypothetical protein